MDEEKHQDLPTGLYWKGKKTEVERIVLPFQTIETVNESRATREKDKEIPLLKEQLKQKKETVWHNRLIWGDNKYVMASLLEEFAGEIDLIYIDPPFATGADFSVRIEVGDIEWTKEPSAIEDKAYRDTWGKGLDSYLQMLHERLILMRDLLSVKGSIYVNLDYRVNSYVRMIMDEVFGKDNLINEIIYSYRIQGISRSSWARKHQTILFYSKTKDDYIFNMEKERVYYEKPFRDIKKDEKGRYYNDVYVRDVWDCDYTKPFISGSNEFLGYTTQKSEGLLKRILNASSNKESLVADFFCGSGTTGAVAEKLGRCWIMCDIGRFAIHTARKRLLDIEGCRPFVVQNLGKYERQYWQGVTFKKKTDEQMPIFEYIQFILKLYNAEPISGMLHIHGKKGKKLIHIGAVDAPVTLSEIQDAIVEVKKMNQNALDVLGWEWEMGLHDVIEKVAKENGVSLHLFNIPRDVMDQRAVEKGEITFYELAHLEVNVKKDKNGEFLVELKDFAIPNLDLIPGEVRSKIKKWSDYIDYWAVDWNWNEDTFHNMWQSYRTRKDRKLELKSDGYKYGKQGKHIVMIKVIDIFGNDTTRVVEVQA